MRQQRIERHKPQTAPQIIDERQPKVPAPRTVFYMEVGDMEPEKVQLLIQHFKRNNMEHWICCKCGCDYNYIDPEVIGGSKYCPMCAVDPLTVKSKQLGTIFWVILSFIVGLIIGTSLR